MARTIKNGKLTALAVVNAKEPGIYGDGAGLWLRVQHNGSKSWSYRYTIGGKSRELGLGPLHTLDLAGARQRARDARLLVLDGKDPIEVRQQAIEAAKIEAGKAETFRSCGDKYMALHKAGWKSEKHIYQWKATLEQYVYPTFGDLPISQVDTALVLKALEPIWQTMPETASRVRGRIERVWDWARVRGHCSGENPARWRGHLESALPKLSDVRVIVHQPALPFAQLGRFMSDLRGQEGIAAAALEFTILCATRTNETINAVWSEIDRKGAVWVIPPERMKGRRGKSREHRVPLTPQALAVLERMAKFGTDGYVFPGMIEDRPLSNMAMLEVLRRMERKTISVHGFRSAFRDWASETSPFPHEVVEMALAHTIKNRAEAAYGASGNASEIVVTEDHSGTQAARIYFEREFGRSSTQHVSYCESVSDLTIKPNYGAFLVNQPLVLNRKASERFGWCCGIVNEGLINVAGLTRIERGQRSCWRLEHEIKSCCLLSPHEHHPAVMFDFERGRLPIVLDRQFEVKSAVLRNVEICSFGVVILADPDRSDSNVRTQLVFGSLASDGQIVASRTEGCTGNFQLIAALPKGVNDPCRSGGRNEQTQDVEKHHPKRPARHILLSGEVIYLAFCFVWAVGCLAYGLNGAGNALKHSEVTSYGAHVALAFCGAVLLTGCFAELLVLGRE